MKVQIEKMGYADGHTRSYSQRDVEFRIGLHTPGHYHAGPISREQLTLFRDQINQLLHTKKKSKYTGENHSNLTATIEADND